MDRADVYLVLEDLGRAKKEIPRLRRIYTRMGLPEGTPALRALESRLKEFS
jgi:hypothetical protein